MYTPVRVHSLRCFVEGHLSRGKTMPRPVQFMRSISRTPSGSPSGTKILIVNGLFGIFCASLLSIQAPGQVTILLPVPPALRADEVAVEFRGIVAVDHH